MAESKSGDLHRIVTNGVRLAGDTMLVPGTSQLLDGQLGAGAVRAAAGIAARAVFGPIGWLAVAADSYAKSSTGKSLVDRIRRRGEDSKPAPAAAEEAPAAAPAEDDSAS